MNEHHGERLTLPKSSDAREIGISESVGRARSPLNRILFLGAVGLAQLLWLGALAYLAFRLV